MGHDRARLQELAPGPSEIHAGGGQLRPPLRSQQRRSLAELKAIGPRPEKGKKEYHPGPYRHKTITEPKERSLHIPTLRDKIVQVDVHEALQDIYRPVFVDRSYACLYGKGPIRAAFNVQHDMRVARMKWGENAAVIKIDVKKFFYSIDRDILKSSSRSGSRS